MEEPSRLSILVVEDDPTDAALVTGYLKADPLIETYSANTLLDAKTRLAAGQPDLILVDLGLPDSSPSETFSEVRASAPQVPIVVLTGQDDEGTAIRTIGEGAQDYLTKHELSNNILLRSIRYSLERHVATQRRLNERIHELQIFETLAPESLQSTAGSIADVQPGVFQGATQAYGNLLDLSVSNDYPGKDDDVRAQSRAIAILLGQLRASPRDLALVHTTVLSEHQQSQPPERFQMFEDVARLLLLRITGELANYYLEVSAGTETAAPAPAAPAPSDSGSALLWETESEVAARPAAAPRPAPAEPQPAPQPAAAEPSPAPAPQPAPPQPAPQRPAASAPPPAREPAPVAAGGNETSRTIAAADGTPLVTLGRVDVRPMEDTDHQSRKEGHLFAAYSSENEVRAGAAAEPTETKAESESEKIPNRLTAADYAAWANRLKKQKQDDVHPEEDADAEPEESKGEYDWSTEALYGYSSESE